MTLSLLDSHNCLSSCGWSWNCYSSKSAFAVLVSMPLLCPVLSAWWMHWSHFAFVTVQAGTAMMGVSTTTTTATNCTRLY